MAREQLDLQAARLDTRIVHLGRDETDPTGALVPPIHPAAAFARESLEATPRFFYSRRGNPTRQALDAASA